MRFYSFMPFMSFTISATMALMGLAAPSPARASTEDEIALKKYYEQTIFDLPFKVTKTAWSDADEEAFGQFIVRIGQAIKARRCGDINACLRHPKINPYAAQDPEGIVFYTDCGRFPYLLRAYFAYHNGLPFEYVTGVRMADRPYSSAPDRDDQLPKATLQNSPYGNIIRARGGSSLARQMSQFPNFQRYLMRVMDAVSTRVLRVGPLSPNYDESDVYPVTLDRNGIRPGTIAVANGHVMVIWNIDPKGNISIIDGHPGGFVQHHLLDRTKLQRSRPDHGLGFFRFRPMRIEGAQTAWDGTLYGGDVETAKDRELYSQGKYSLDQWFGPGSNVQPGSRVDPNAYKQAFRDVDFFTYLGAQMRQAGSVAQADEAMDLIFDDMCGQVKAREKTVNAGIKSGLGQRPHPAALPADIYGSSTEDKNWEPYSTPGGDGRLRDSVRNALQTAIAQFRLAKSGSPQVVFKGGPKDYQTAVRARLARIAKTCGIAYLNSNGQSVRLSLNEVFSRLNRLSWDPYMCPEKLWGAADSEFATCRDQDAGNRWYDAEASIRNTVGKQNDDDVLVVHSDRPITLEMLESGAYVDRPSKEPIALGTSKAPLMNLDGYLASEAFLKALDQGQRP